jgi:hypothetical protein
VYLQLALFYDVNVDFTGAISPVNCIRIVAREQKNSDESDKKIFHGSLGFFRR